jgi:tetratricopeptide (TPR) repeat protein
LRIQILIQQDRLAEVKTALESFLEDYPTYFEARWQLANVNFILGDKAKGADLAEKVLLEGRKLDPIGKMDWLIVYFSDTNQAQRLVPILELQAKINPKDPEVYTRLADAYKKTGQKEQAIAAARMVEQLDPTAKADVEAFIKTLQ